MVYGSQNIINYHKRHHNLVFVGVLIPHEIVLCENFNVAKTNGEHPRSHNSETRLCLKLQCTGHIIIKLLKRQEPLKHVGKPFSGNLLAGVYV